MQILRMSYNRLFRASATRGIKSGLYPAFTKILGPHSTRTFTPEELSELRDTFCAATTRMPNIIGECVPTHTLLFEFITKKLNMPAVLTCGSVNNSNNMVYSFGDKEFKQAPMDVTNRLFPGHFWITLMDGRILDASYDSADAKMNRGEFRLIAVMDFPEHLTRQYIPFISGGHELVSRVILNPTSINL